MCESVRVSSVSSELGGDGEKQGVKSVREVEAARFDDDTLLHHSTSDVDGAPQRNIAQTRQATLRPLSD